MVEQKLDWNKLAYVQMVRDHVELCSAVMLLGDFSRLKSPAKRILLFPKAWLKEIDQEVWDPQLVTTQRLLRTAVRRYGIVLMPVGPIVDGADGESSCFHPNRLQTPSLDASTDYDQTHCHPHTPSQVSSPSSITSA
jgi:hypothetical protein